MPSQPPHRLHLVMSRKRSPLKMSSAPSPSSSIPAATYTPSPNRSLGDKLQLLAVHYPAVLQMFERLADQLLTSIEKSGNGTL